MERIELRPGYSISRIIKGGWHLAGGHGKISKPQALHDMLAFVESGITTFDCADIYTGVEELIGAFITENRDAFRSGSLPPIQVHTKYVPDLATLSSLRRIDVERIIDRSLDRLGVESLDLVQFHWWDYTIPGYLDVLQYLEDFKNLGKIRCIGLTNFNYINLQEILNEGFDILSHQVQYSVLDQRAKKYQSNIANEHNVSFLAYGSIAGGFISDKYLDTPEPSGSLENRSLTKYKLIIDDFGGWAFFQQLLQLLRDIGQTHAVDIATVGMKYVLQQSSVAGIIVGARNQEHLPKFVQVANVNLSKEELSQIDAVVSKSFGPSGLFYDLERDRNGKHGKIMKYNLNKGDEN